MAKINVEALIEIEKQFVNKYSLEFIERLDDETGGIFSQALLNNDIRWLRIYADTELVYLTGRLWRQNEFEVSDGFTYEDFKKRIHDLLVISRTEESLSGGILTTREFPTYDFIQGSFREEFNDIFLNITEIKSALGIQPNVQDKDSIAKDERNIDEALLEKIQKMFYSGTISPQIIHEHPQLVEILKNKDLSCIQRSKLITVGTRGLIETADGRKIQGVPPSYHFAEYILRLSNKDEFLDLCQKYGDILYEIGFLPNEAHESIENTRIAIQDALYRIIISKRISYDEEMPEEFKLKYPDLFLPDTISPNLKGRYYSGNLTLDDLRENNELAEILRDKNIEYRISGICTTPNNKQTIRHPINDWLSKDEIITLAEKYGLYFAGTKKPDGTFLTFEEKEEYIKSIIENKILKRGLWYGEEAPEFFKKAHPELFLPENAPEELKLYFYDGYTSSDEKYKNHVSNNYRMSFKVFKEHPEWISYFEGKDLKRIFPAGSAGYNRFFEKFDYDTALKFAKRCPETIDAMVSSRKEAIIETWYNATGRKFLPHHVIMMNFPENDIDKFLANGKTWSKLMRIDRFNINDDGKAAILKAAYSMGIFHSESESQKQQALTRMIELFSGVPNEINSAQYDEIVFFLENLYENSNMDNKEEYFENLRVVLGNAYRKSETGNYVLAFDKQKDCESIKELRLLLELVEKPDNILTFNKAHQLFGAFAMKYDPDFSDFLWENIDEVLSNPDILKDMVSVQEQFQKAKIHNAGKKFDLQTAIDFVRSPNYENIEIGNENLASYAKKASYSQEKYEAIQKLYNEGITREFSSIPRVEGDYKAENQGYTYEMLRLDDALALTIGTMTDCCQEINNAGQTSMEHSMVSEDGRVFCVRDEEGKIVSQSWVWRNGDVICFDNIEIPDRIFRDYSRKNPNKGKNGLTKEVLEVYKKASLELMQKDQIAYQELLDNGDITKEEYDALILGKVTIGLGYNDIADAIKRDKEVKKDNEIVLPESTDRLPSPYTDADEQYIVAERENRSVKDFKARRIHQDNIAVYDESNMPDSVIRTMKRMEEAAGRNRVNDIKELKTKERISDSTRFANNLAYEYDFEPENTKIMVASRTIILYSEEEGMIQIGDFFTAPINEEFTEEQTKTAENYIHNQLKKSIKQLQKTGKKINFSELPEEQKEELESLLQEIENERSER